MVIVSDYLHHAKYSVHVFYLDENIQPIESIVMFWMEHQFKQCFLFYSLTLMNRDITWNFFATTTSHGKGPVDGIGGMVMRVVSREVMSGSVDISREFATVATDNCKEKKSEYWQGRNRGH